MLNVLRCQFHIVGTSCDQCRSMVQYSFTGPPKPEGSLGRTAQTSTSTLTQLLNYELKNKYRRVFIVGGRIKAGWGQVSQFAKRVRPHCLRGRSEQLGK